MNYRKITSPSNPLIKEAAALRETGRKKGRSSFVIEGPHLIEMAVRAGAEIRDVFFADSSGSKKEDGELLNILSKRTRDIFEVTPQLLKKIADTETPQGLVAVVEYSEPSLDKLRLGGVPLLAVVDGVQDPVHGDDHQNVGCCRGRRCNPPSRNL